MSPAKIVVSAVTPILVDEPGALGDCCAALEAAPWLAVDTEFVRENTYYPRPCLVQVAVPGAVYCVDPIAIRTLDPLPRVITGDLRVKVLHAARQDFELFLQLFGAIPRPVFDTQIAAAFAGFSDQIGYGALVEALCGVKLDKTHTRTDWMRRPLTASELDYAAEDVAYLHPMMEKLVSRLESLGRRAWVEEEFERLLDPALYRTAPDDAWKRIKAVTRMSPADQAALRLLAAWRETAAQERNLPRNWLVHDDVLVALALQRPTSTGELAQVRGIAPAFVRRHGDSILAVIAQLARGPAEPETTAVLPPSPAARRLAAELQALVRARAAAAGIAAAVVATRRDVEQAVAGAADARLFEGWRRAFIGDEIATRIAAAGGGADKPAGA